MGSSSLVNMSHLDPATYETRRQIKPPFDSVFSDVDVVNLEEGLRATVDWFRTTRTDSLDPCAASRPFTFSVAVLRRDWVSRFHSTAPFRLELCRTETP